MLHYFKPGWIAIGVMGLAASLVSTFANNVSGFSSACVQGVYQAWIRPRESDAHYLWAGRITNVLAVIASIGAAYSARSFQSLMEYIQMILSTFNAPIFALVALAALVPRRAQGGGFLGLFAGLVTSGAHQVLVFAGVLHYGSRMATNFYAAIISFVVSALATIIAGRSSVKCESANLNVRPPGRIAMTCSRFTLAWGLLISIACVGLNVWLR
jgi:SSS family solute:Na+ symporter